MGYRDAVPGFPRAALLAAVLALAATACTGDGGTTATTAAGTGAPEAAVTSTTRSETTTPPPSQLDGLPGLLVVLAEDGNVVTMRPDGSDLALLTDDAGPQLQYSQPTWAPDGSRVAWTRVDGRAEGAPAAAVLTAAPDGSDQTEAATPLPVFYMFWDPTSRKLAYLHSGIPTLEMGIVDVAAGGGDAATVDTGQPYYFSWAPDGETLLAHVGTDRLDEVDAASGDPAAVAGPPGTFQAPSWSGDGSQLYAVAADSGETLVRRDAAGDETELLAYDGFIWFLPSPDGSQVAFQVLREGDEGGVTAAADRPALATRAFQLAQPADAPVGALAVLDLASGEIDTLAADSAVGFFWSPRGTLLSLHLDADRSGWFRWRIWGDQPFTGPSYQPTATVARDYLPFFDQYAQSLTPWSPDGTAFTYAGRHEGERGIWVQRLDPDAAPVRVAGGTFAAWSPSG